MKSCSLKTHSSKFNTNLKRSVLNPSSRSTLGDFSLKFSAKLNKIVGWNCRLIKACDKRCRSWFFCATREVYFFSEPFWTLVSCLEPYWAFWAPVSPLKPFAKLKQIVEWIYRLLRLSTRSVQLDFRLYTMPPHFYLVKTFEPFRAPKKLAQWALKHFAKLYFTQEKSNPDHFEWSLVSHDKPF